MSVAVVTIEIDNPRPVYYPGDTLAGCYRLPADAPPEVERLEVSVLWRTQGKGEEDIGVHFFEKLAPQEPLDAREVRRFSTRLPASPLSYDGLIVKILWCVRVRASLRGGQEMVGETPFQLGDVPRPQEVTATSR
jgi:hypothetical protein